MQCIHIKKNIVSNEKDYVVVYLWATRAAAVEDEETVLFCVKFNVSKFCMSPHVLRIHVMILNFNILHIPPPLKYLLLLAGWLAAASFMCTCTSTRRL